MIKNRALIALYLVIAGSAVLGGLYFTRVWYAGHIAMDLVKEFTFSDEGPVREWKEKVLRGKTLYRVVAEGNEKFVLATSKSSASALFFKIRMDMARRPVISWRWQVREFPEKNGTEDLSSVKADDFAARVYVIFPSMLFTNSRALEYIWTENVKEGVIVSSPYSKNMKLVVVESGGQPGGGWVSEERDIYADYVAAFGEEPRYDIGAIAIMTDSDSTGSSAEAAFDDIKIGYKKDKGGEPG